jgi:hypothetical protein
MLFREVMTVCSEDRIKPIGTQCEQSVEIFNIKADSTDTFAPISLLPEGFMQCACFGKHT